MAIASNTVDGHQVWDIEDRSVRQFSSGQIISGCLFTTHKDFGLISFWVLGLLLIFFLLLGSTLRMYVTVSASTLSSCWIMIFFGVMFLLFSLAFFSSGKACWLLLLVICSTGIKFTRFVYFFYTFLFAYTISPVDRGYVGRLTFFQSKFTAATIS